MIAKEREKEFKICAAEKLLLVNILFKEVSFKASLNRTSHCTFLQNKPCCSVSSRPVCSAGSLAKTALQLLLLLALLQYLFLLLLLVISIVFVSTSLLKVTITGRTCIEYEKPQNKIIEEAFQKKKKDVRLVDDSGNVYIINFDSMREYLENEQDDFVYVIRRDKTGLTDRCSSFGPDSDMTKLRSHSKALFLAPLTFLQTPLEGALFISTHLSADISPTSLTSYLHSSVC